MEVFREPVEPKQREMLFGNQIRFAIETVKAFRQRRQERRAREMFDGFAHKALEEIEGQKQPEEPEAD